MVGSLAKPEISGPNTPRVNFRTFTTNNLHRSFPDHGPVLSPPRNRARARARPSSSSSIRPIPTNSDRKKIFLFVRRRGGSSGNLRLASVKAPFKLVKVGMAQLKQNKKINLPSHGRDSWYSLHSWEGVVLRPSSSCSAGPLHSWAHIKLSAVNPKRSAVIRSDPQSKNIFDRNFGSQSPRRSEPIRGKTNQIEPDRGKKNPHHIFKVCKVSRSATFSPLPYHLSPLASLPCPLHHLAPNCGILHHLAHKIFCAPCAIAPGNGTKREGGQKSIVVAQ